jgi:hypothetical protein
MADGVFGFLGDLLGLNAGDPAIAAASANKKVLNNTKTEGMGYLDTGYNDARSALNDTKSLTDLGPNAGDVYRGALGLGGAAGHTAAVDAFRTDPGYQFQMDQGLQAIDRSNAARGGFQSGGAGLDEMRFSQGLADQSYNDWFSRLTGGIDRASGTNTNLASLATGNGLAKTGLATDIASGFLDTNNQKAEGQSANKSGLSNLFGNVVGAFTGYGGF